RRDTRPVGGGASSAGLAYHAAVSVAETAPESDPTREQHGAWAALRYRQYRILWLATIAAILTAELRLVVTGVWLYEETGSAAQLGILGLIQLFVQIPALLFGGTLADRLDRRWLMAWTQAVTLLFVAGPAVLGGAGPPHPRA